MGPYLVQMCSCYRRFMDEGDVVDLAENIVADSATVEYPMPSLSDITSVDGTEATEGSHPASRVHRGLHRGP